MKLTTKNAHLYLGKKLDANKRLFHNYPLEVRKIEERYFVKDSAGVNMPVPEERDTFNSIYFDFVV
jgi:hypothetical protein